MAKSKGKQNACLANAPASEAGGAETDAARIRGEAGGVERPADKQKSMTPAEVPPDCLADCLAEYPADCPAEPAELPPANSGQTKARKGKRLSPAPADRGIKRESTDRRVERESTDRRIERESTDRGISQEPAYRPEFCQALVAHFSVLKTDSQGKVIGIPSFVSFGDTIGVSPDTIAVWRKNYPAFASACRHAEALLKAMLIDCALCERVNVTAAKFLLSSLFDLSEEKAPAAPPALTAEDRALLSNLWERLNRGSLSPSDAD